MSEPANSLVGLLSKRALDEADRTAYTFLEDGRTETGSLTSDRALLIYRSGLEVLKAFFGCLYTGGRGSARSAAA